jgi:hypothetical protein
MKPGSCPGKWRQCLKMKEKNMADNVKSVDIVIEDVEEQILNGAGVPGE